MHDSAVIYFRDFSFHVSAKLFRFLGIGCLPFGNGFLPFGHNGEEFFAARSIELLHLIAYDPGIFRIAAEIAHGRGIIGTALAQRLSVGVTLSFV